MTIAQIDLSHRVTIVGGPGDGKTTIALKIAKHIVQRHKVPMIALNPGAEEKLYQMFGPPRLDIDTTWPEYQHITPPVTQDKRKYGYLFAHIVQHGNNLTYIDETDEMGDGNRYSLWMKYLYHRGRRRNCCVIAVSQRPVDIPPFCYKLADHIFVGDVMGTDLKRIEELTQQPWAAAIQARKQYEFLYWSRHLKEPPKAVFMR